MKKIILSIGLIVLISPICIVGKGEEVNASGFFRSIRNFFSSTNSGASNSPRHMQQNLLGRTSEEIEVDVLINRHLVGSINPDEIRRLSELLGNDDGVKHQLGLLSYNEFYQQPRQNWREDQEMMVDRLLTRLSGDISELRSNSLNRSIDELSELMEEDIRGQVNSSRVRSVQTGGSFQPNRENIRNLEVTHSRSIMEIESKPPGNIGVNNITHVKDGILTSIDYRENTGIPYKISTLVEMNDTYEPIFISEKRDSGWVRVYNKYDNQ